MSEKAPADPLVTPPPKTPSGPPPGHTPGSQHAPGGGTPQRLLIPKEKVCAFAPRLCRRPCLSGQDFCIRHILGGKPTSEFAQCSFIAPRSGKKCGNAARVCTPGAAGAGKQFCRAHSMKVLAILRLAQAREKEQPDMRRHFEAVLNKYEENNSAPPDGPAASDARWSAFSAPPPDREPAGSLTPHAVTSWTEGQAAADEQVAVDSEEERVDRLPVTRFALHTIEGDTSFHDLHLREPLRHACIYTAEEVARTVGAKLGRLQQLYRQQLTALEHELRLSRVQYIRAVNHQQQQSTPPHKPTSSAVRRRRQVAAVLRGLKQHKGQEALLRTKFREKRRILHSTAAFLPQKGTSFTTKCGFVIGSSGTKCGRVALPRTRFCLEHILSDKGQVLFRPCPVAGEEKSCPEPLLPLDTACLMHRALPARTASPPRL